MSAVRDVVEVLARALTDKPDQVEVRESQHKATTLVELFVAPGELGKVIGKQGGPRRRFERWRPRPGKRKARPSRSRSGTESRSDELG